MGMTTTGATGPGITGSGSASCPKRGPYTTGRIGRNPRLFVCLFTLVKAVKYGSILPFKHFRALCRMLPEIRQARKAFR